MYFPLLLFKIVKNLHKATAVWPVAAPMAQAIIGSKPSNLYMQEIVIIIIIKILIIIIIIMTLIIANAARKFCKLF